MFSPELMKFIIKYQSKEFLPEEKELNSDKNDGIQFRFHHFTKFATVPVKAER